MRKLTKKALSLVLSVMLVVSAISCAFSVIAETVGTSTQPTRGWVVYDAPYSLDGSKGVSSWLGKVATTNTDDPYLVVADGVITSGEGATEGTGWHEAGPARFKIPNAVAGTKVTISFDFAVNLEGLSDEALEKVEAGERLLWPVFRQYNFADASTILEDIQQIFPSDDGKTIVSTEFTLSGPDDFFRIILRGCKTARYAWEVRNITVTVTHPNGTVEIYPSAQEGGNEGGNDVIEIPSYYGTNADGFNSKYSSWPQRLKPADSIDNLDFSKGFVYWSGRNANEDGNGTFASSSFKLVNSETNKYVTLRNEGYIDNMRTALFKVDGVEVGDKIVAIYFANGTDAENLRLVVLQDYIRNVTYDATTGLNTTATNASPGGETQLTVAETEPDEFQFQAEDTNWTAYIAPNSEVVVDPTTKSSTVVPTANIYLQVMITKANGVNAGDKLDVAIDNIILAKEVDGVYYDLATGEEITQETIDNMAPPSIDSTAGDDNQGGTTIPSYYGTESNGFTSAGASWPNKLKPADDIYNLDFSNGFIYWSGRNAGLYPDFTSTYASDSFKLVTEGDNKYITMRDEGYVDSMRSALFNASNYVAIGDELALVYDAKGADADKIRVTLQQDHLRGSDYVSYDPTTGLNTTSHNASPGIPNVLVNNEAELTAISAADGWTTYVTSFTNAVNDPIPVSTSKVCLPDIFLQIIIQNGKGIVAGDQLDAAIDNIRIAKVANGVYTDILTGDVLYTDPAYGKVAKVGDSYYETFEEALEAAKNTEEKVVTVLESIVITEDGTIDLGGVTVYAADSVQNTPVFRILANVTFKGGSVDGTTGINSYAFIVGNSETAGNLTITDGTYRGVTTAVQVTNGVANIKGGTFETGHDNEGTDWGTQYLLNCMDSAYNDGTAVFNITGGTFVGFNPESNTAEGADTNFLATEYMAQDNGDGSYSVVERPREIYCVKGFKPTNSQDTRYGFLMTMAIDSLDYKKDGCGFYLTVGDTTQKFVIKNGVVWESLSVDLPDGTVVLTPDQYSDGENKLYIMNYTVYFTEAQLETLGSMEVSVQGFVTTFDGDEILSGKYSYGTLVD